MKFGSRPGAARPVLVIFALVSALCPRVFAQSSFKSVNSELRNLFKITSYETAFSGTTASGANCDVFIKDKMYDPEAPSDDVVVVAQFEDGSGYQHLGFQVGPASVALNASRASDSLTLTTASASWLTTACETMTLTGISPQKFPNVTMTHHGAVGAGDYQNTCQDLRRN